MYSSWHSWGGGGGSYTVIYVQFMAQLGGGAVIQLYMYSSWHSWGELYSYICTVHGTAGGK